MNHVVLSPVNPPWPLALEEALLDGFDSGDTALRESGGVLCFWEPQAYFVVTGYGNRVATEVNVPACQAAGVPVYRRCSGGGTVLQGPGCLNYALIIKIEPTGPTANISSTNQYCMERTRGILSELLGREVQVSGHTDLAVGGRKFSGNAQRRRREYLIFHGCFLLRMDLAKIGQYLLMPTRQPEYRANRAHQEFLLNLELPAGQLISALNRGWGTRRPLPTLPLARAAELMEEKYNNKEWNLRF